MAVFSLRRYLTPLIHVLVWLLFGVTFLLFEPLTGRLTSLPTQFWVKQALMFGVWIALFYFNARVLVPRLLFRGHMGRLGLALLGLVAGIQLLSWALSTALDLTNLINRAFEAINLPPPPPRTIIGSFRFDPKSILTTLLVLGISTAIAVVQHWQQDARTRQELEQQRVGAELATLKAQINPHFFFNTLNNIYSLTLSDGEKARAAIHRLSRMMRYVLYDTTSGSTCLGQEADFIRDYIDLMQLRLTDRVRIVFDRPEPLHDAPIAPMLLLPFIENAFKHGVAATAHSHICIALRQPQASIVELEVRNSRLPAPGADLAGSNGIGLANTRRRLDLLYPGRYQLQVDERTPENEFRVHLTIQVA
ncbi:histidine kinase [Hymenobacter saemangeumensis]|uniref:Histidine kinase n=1 Tax=Hymenobacter saemangeumensis TaxID=1084522 RepID=A0ABP8HZB4_9BACT